MDDAPFLFGFFQVDSQGAPAAYAFHKSFADNRHIWLRTEEQIKSYAEQGELLAVAEMRSRKFVGLCYSILEGDSWEIGGLTVIDTHRKLHLGSCLVNFALAYTLVYSSPWDNGQSIIAHVHEGNEKPRNVLLRAGFKFLRKIEAPDNAPASMERNAHGKVVGDEFVFPPASTKTLSRWFRSEFNGILADGSSKAEFDFGPGSLDDVRVALDDIATKYVK